MRVVVSIRCQNRIPAVVPAYLSGIKEVYSIMVDCSHHCRLDVLHLDCGLPHRVWQPIRSWRYRYVFSTICNTLQSTTNGMQQNAILPPWFDDKRFSPSIAVLLMSCQTLLVSTNKTLAIKDAKKRTSLQSWYYLWQCSKGFKCERQQS